MTILDQINHYWKLITFVGIGIFYILWTFFRVNAHEEKLIKMDIRVSTLEKSSDSFREEIKVSISRIETTLDFIKQAIVDLKGK